MAMSEEELVDFKDALSLLSADELRAQMGDGAEEDALIQAQLDLGKAVETKGSKAVDSNNEDGDDNTMGTPKKEPSTKANDVDDEDDGDEDDGDEDDDGDSAAAVAAAKVASDAAAATAAEAAAATAAESTVEIDPATLAAQLQPLDLSYLDTKFATKMEELDTAKAEKFQALMDGTIDAKEYSKFESQYMRDRDSLKDERANESTWFTGVHNFKLDALAKSGINYDTDQVKADSWDAWIKHLAANPANANKDSAWFLNEAHRKVMVEFEISPNTVATKQKPAQNVADGKKVSEKAGRAPKLDDIPPTLGGLPAAAEIETGDDGEFAHLDKLNGMAYERAIAALTPAQKERYEST
jgi:hypothetical protein